MKWKGAWCWVQACLVWCSPRRWCWWRRRSRLHPWLLLIDWAEREQKRVGVRWVHLVFSPWSAPVTRQLKDYLVVSPIAAFIVFASPICSFYWWVQSFPRLFPFHSLSYTRTPHCVSPSLAATLAHNDNLLQSHLSLIINWGAVLSLVNKIPKTANKGPLKFSHLWTQTKILSQIIIHQQK